MLDIDLKGKKAFIAGIGDDQGYGWAIAKALAGAGATLIIGTWAPIYKIFTTSLANGKFDASRTLPNGELMQFEAIYPMDASFDTQADVPSEIAENKRYAGYTNYAMKELANLVEIRHGRLDILVHSLANGPEVAKPLLETSRQGYLAAISSSAYSFVSLLRYFGPFMNEGGAALCLSYMASTSAVPGYGGGMSSAKAALESDTRTLAWEAGRKWKVRLNCISAGALSSRAARAIGFIDKMIDYSLANAPLQKELQAQEVGNAAAFLASPLASAITGATLFVDNGMHAMGLAADSTALNT